MTFGSLFAGIGGFDLGLEAAGHTCSWQVENDPYATKVLERHWPHVRRYDDVRTFPPPGDWNVDLVCGGFPCQDLSPVRAGQRAGLHGSQSSLWTEFHRVIRQLRPQYVLVENSPSLLVRGLGTILGDLASIGYDAEWHCIPAAALGAHHLRARLWILAYPTGLRDRTPQTTVQPRRDLTQHRPRWPTESPVDRVAYGVPNRTHRLRSLGNAVVPQVVTWIAENLI